MNRIRFFTDEDIYAAVVVGLRRVGFDAVSSPETDRLGESDEAQLQWAADEGRVLVTFNVAHFARLHCEWIQQQRHHASDVVSSQRPIGELVRRLRHLGQTLDGAAMRDRLELLSDW